MSALPRPSFDRLFADLPRLSSGHICTMILGWMWSHPDPGPEIIVSLTELASLCRCDISRIERELGAMQERGLAAIRYLANSQVGIDFKYADFEALPDYTGKVTDL